MIFFCFQSMFYMCNLTSFMYWFVLIRTYWFCYSMFVAYSCTVTYLIWLYINVLNSPLFFLPFKAVTVVTCTLLILKSAPPVRAVQQCVQRLVFKIGNRFPTFLFSVCLSTISEYLFFIFKCNLCLLYYLLHVYKKLSFQSTCSID